jgi:exosortase/archaeosortase family protein
MGALWAPVLLGLATIVAFWRSAESMWPLIALDQSVGLAPALPFLAVWLAVSTNRRRVAAGQPLIGQREVVVDVPVAAAVLGGAAWLVWRAPRDQGWYFWSSRLDLLAAALFAVGVAVLLWGVQTVLWHRWAWAYALLTWPEPLARVQSVVAAPLGALTASAVRPLANMVHVALAPVGSDPSVFASAAEPGWVFVVGDACSGLNAGLTVGLLAVPVAAHLGIRRRHAFGWLIAGVTLALASNVVRILMVLFAAQSYGPEVALGSIHPVLGAILLLLVLALLWWWAPRPRREVATRTASAGVEPRQSALRSYRLLAPLVGALVAVFAMGSARLSIFEPLAPIGPPGSVLSDPLEYVRLPAGWQVAGRSAMAWHDLFGRDSSAYAMSFRSADGALVKAQFVATPEHDRLRAYSLEACRVYHGDDVVGERTVDLGAGGIASLIDTWDRRPFDPAGRMSVLYWEAPFSLEGRTMHARMALFVVELDAGVLPATGESGIAPGGQAFDRADTLLVSLARGMAGELLGTTANELVDVGFGTTDV